MSITAGPAGKTLSPELSQALARLSEISSLPEITTRIVQVVEDPRATAHDMHEIVRSDPALATKILKVVNSAFYGLPSQIASLERAILLLGLSAVKNIALAASLSRLFSVEAITEQFAARDLWRHCIAVGVCARRLADMIHSSQVDETFVAGLVHDMGLMAVQQLFPAKLRAAAERCLVSGERFCTVEEALVGGDHQTFGGALAARWRFPPGLRYAIAYHHDVEALQPEFQKLTALVCVADTLCCRARFGFWLTAHTQEIPGPLLDMAGLKPEQIDPVLDELPERVEEAEHIFIE